MSTNEFVNNFQQNPMMFLTKTKVALQRTSPKWPALHHAYLYAKYDALLTKYILSIYDTDEDDRVKVQYLPFQYDSGLYIELQKLPVIFVTAKLTGCDLAFRRSGEAVRVVHMNFDESAEARTSTLSAYESDEYTLFKASEGYKGETVVLGVRKDNAWQIYAQDSDMWRVTQIL